MVSIYGEWIKDFKHEFSVKKSEDYGNISFSFPDIGEFPDSVDFIVELLGQNDQPVQVQKVADGEVTFRFVAPGAYYARAYVDANRKELLKQYPTADDFGRDYVVPESLLERLIEDGKAKEIEFSPSSTTSPSR